MTAKRKTASASIAPGAVLLHAVADATPKMPDARGHNGRDFAADELAAYVHRVENVEAEIKGLNDGKKTIYAEAKSNGYHLPTLKQVIADRRVDKAALAEKKAMLDLYHQRLAEAEEL